MPAMPESPHSGCGPALPRRDAVLSDVRLQLGRRPGHARRAAAASTAPGLRRESRRLPQIFCDRPPPQPDRRIRSPHPPVATGVPPTLTGPHVSSGLRAWVLLGQHGFAAAKPKELRIAELEMAPRQDVYTRE